MTPGGTTTHSLSRKVSQHGQHLPKSLSPHMPLGGLGIHREAVEISRMALLLSQSKVLVLPFEGRVHFYRYGLYLPPKKDLESCLLRFPKSVADICSLVLNVRARFETLCISNSKCELILSTQVKKKKA